ncbi:MAG: TIGR02646 family protein [Lachnospiraceae bacterium]|jgi:uncharacterized protein (TIGR02646 family)|nr:TIGR02646 family protein [Lachnospiraceae bacterium]
MIFIEKEGLSSSVKERIIGIRKSEAWKAIEEGNTTAIRNIFNNDFPKDEVKRILIHEQHGLCAYCMKRIKDDNHSRVEHLVPLSKDKENAINYSNMLGVCDGGEKATGQQGKVLCCDAYKKENELFLSPLNKVQMDKIAYKPDGTIHTNPFDKDMETDINETLHLNGIRKADGTIRDTATEVLKGRRDTYERAKLMMDKLNREGKCNSITLKKLMETLSSKEEREEYVGVKIFYFTKKYKSFVRRGL